MKVDVYARGVGKIGEVSFCEDLDEAWESIADNLGAEVNKDGTLTVFYSGKVIFNSYKPDFDVEKFKDEDGDYDIDSIVEKLYEEFINKDIIYLVEP